MIQEERKTSKQRKMSLLLLKMTNLMIGRNKRMMALLLVTFVKTQLKFLKMGK